VDLLNGSDDLAVLEIGAGDGAMTKELLRWLETEKDLLRQREKEKVVRLTQCFWFDAIEYNGDDFEQLKKSISDTYEGTYQRRRNHY